MILSDFGRLITCIGLVCSLVGCTTRDEAGIASNNHGSMGDYLEHWNRPSDLAISVVDGELWLDGGTREHWWSSEDTYQSFIWELELNHNFSDQVKIGFGLNSANEGNIISLDTDSASLYPLGTIMEHSRSRWNFPHMPQWLPVKIQVEGQEMSVWIDNEEVSFARDSIREAGFLGIKVTDKLGVRNMRIQPLSTTKDMEQLLEAEYRGDQRRRWIHWFDEMDLQGWTNTGNGTWTFEEDGSLKGTAVDGADFLISPQLYQDFYLQTDFKIEHEENSGIFIRKHPDSTVSLNDAIECNIYDHNGPAHPYSTGSMVTHARSWYGMINYDEWNHMEIMAKGPLVVIYINGRLASQYHFEEPFVKPGQIALQAGTRVFTDDGPSTVWFRSVRIKRFDPER